jgi:hypothetical protein
LVLSAAVGNDGVGLTGVAGAGKSGREAVAVAVVVVEGVGDGDGDVETSSAAAGGVAEFIKAEAGSTFGKKVELISPMPTKKSSIHLFSVFPSFP